jgi:hypothetical protein
MPDSRGLEALFCRLYLGRQIMTRLAVDLRGRGFGLQHVAIRPLVRRKIRDHPQRP